jgi:photosystem II stability/assembly factor-like uncharacterized protein
MASLSRLACVILLALAVLSTASAGVNTPQSGWYSGNPLLGPNTLRDLACSGPTCYAAGDFGTLLKSTDAGTTWSGIVTGLTLDVSRVGLAGDDPDTVLAGGGCALRRSGDGGNTFTRLPFTARDTGCREPLASFSFPTGKVGYLLLTSGRVLATDDGGLTFSRRTSVPAGSKDILCTKERTCFVGSPSGAILRSLDGGVSWTQVANFPSSSAFSLGQADSLTLYAVGTSLQVVKSIDGGANWVRKTAHDVPFSDLVKIRCGDALHCLIGTVQGSQLLRTEDGGDTYRSVVPSSDASFALAFAGPSRALAAGMVGSAEVSNDAGATWAAVGSRIAGSFTQLAAVSDTIAYAGGESGVLARTRDAGQTWANVSPPTEATIVGLAGSGPNRLYVLASDGSLQRSDNGGSSYRLLNPGTVQPRAILAPTADRLLLISPGQILLSVNGGEAFRTVGGRLARRTRPVSGDLATGAIFANGARRAMVSTDGGSHWRAVRVPRRREIFDFDFVTARVGYLLDTEGHIWKTMNGGRRWADLKGIGTADGYQLAFANRSSGYVVAFGRVGNRQLTFALRTADGGLSWHPQIVSPTHVDRLVSGGATDYALAGMRDLYATQTGGDIGGAEHLTLTPRRRSLRRAGAVVLTGRLSPADGGEEIVVARRSGNRWARRVVIAAANGTFTTRFRISRTSVFVAQVLGDDDHVGAGTPPLTVRVG